MNTEFSRIKHLADLQLIVDAVKIEYVQTALESLSGMERRAVIGKFYFGFELDLVAELLGTDKTRAAREITNGTRKFRDAFVAQHEHLLSETTRQRAPGSIGDAQITELFRNWGDAATSPGELEKLCARVMAAIEKELPSGQKPPERNDKALLRLSRPDTKLH